jgi:16S rRNA (uracil1498-N3)-methyltransferase
VVGSAGGGGGRGRHRSASHEVRLEPDGPIMNEAPPTVRLVLAFSLVKGDRTDWAVAKLTELGTDVIVPLVCERTIVRPDDEPGQPRVLRLQRIAREASMQSRRVRLPEVTEPHELASVLGAYPAGSVCISEPGGGAPSLTSPVVLIGPEGGWSNGELDLVQQSGVRQVSLGAHVLRVETAAVAAAAILGAMRIGASTAR